MKKIKTFVHFADFIDAHEQESDRGYVIVAIAILDSALEYSLRRSMRQNPNVVKCNINPLFAHNGPLCSFWSKLNIAYTTRVIPEWVYRDLEIVRGIRNSVAHTYHTFAFTDPEVQNTIMRLRSPYRAAGKNNRYVTEAQFKNEMKRLTSEEWMHFSESKLRFSMMFHYIHGFLTDGRAYSKRRPNKALQAIGDKSPQPER